MPFSWTTLLFILASCWVRGGDAAATKINHLYADTGLNNVLFTDSVLFQSPAQSEIDCGRECSLWEFCVTFTFHQHTCRGHSVLMTSHAMSTPATGARTYVRQGIQSVEIRCEKTGVKKITDASLGLYIDVYCEDDWMVFQKRQDGSVDFFRRRESYVKGFGNISGEHWVGLESLHRITTSSANYELRIDLTKFDGNAGSVYYSNFSVGPAIDNYRLNFDTFLGGTTNDAMETHRGSQFTTWDADHDTQDGWNCATRYSSAWWYSGCGSADLNRVYLTNSTQSNRFAGITWMPFASFGVDSLKSCKMMIRPMN